MKTTHLSENHFSFQLKTLVLVMSKMSARPFIVQDRAMTELDPIETDEVLYKYSDNEGYSVSPTGRGTASGTETHNKEHYEKVYLNYFSGKVKDLDAQEHFDRIILFAPHELKNEVHDKLETHIAEKTKIIPGNYYKSEPLEIIEMLNSDKS